MWSLARSGFLLSIAFAAAASASTSSGTLSLSATAYTVSEGGGSIAITVDRTGGSAGPVSVFYTTVAGTATLSDYSPKNGRLYWTASDTSPKTFTVPILDKDDFTGSKQFSVEIKDEYGGAALGTQTATVTIQGNGGAGMLQLASGSYTVSQSLGSLTVAVNRTGGSVGAVSVFYSTVNGSAAASNFSGKNGRLSWADGDKSPKTFVVPINDAVPFSGTKQFTIAISDLRGAAIFGTPTTSTATIIGASAVPSVPTGLSASPGNAQVGLTWAASSGATNYHVKRATSSGGSYTEIGAPASTSYSDTSVTNGTKYYYVVSALDPAGGSANSSAVSATPVAATAGTCASVPASGDWDSASVSPVTPPAGEPSYEQNGKPMAIVVDPFVPSTVWLGTGSSGIYKSTNCGAAGSWVKIDTGANHAALDASDIWSMAVDPDPSRQGVIYALASYGDNGIWKSVNGGVDWTQLKIGSNSTLAAYFWSNMSMDASNTLHIAVTTHGTTSVSGYANGAIAESFDGGATWPNIVPMPAAWGEQGGVYLIPGTTSGTHSTWLWGTGDNFAGTYITQNSGASWPITINDTAMGENNILPLQKASNGWYYLPAIKGLIKSQDGINWSQAWNQNSNFQTPITDGFAVTGSTIYAGNSTSLYSAPLSNDSNWTVMPNPSALTSSDYIGFMAYDNAHGILYISTWHSVFRYNVPSSSR